LGELGEPGGDSADLGVTPLGVISMMTGSADEYRPPRDGMV